MNAFLYESCQNLTADAVSVAKFAVFVARLALDSVFSVFRLMFLQIVLRMDFSNVPLEMTKKKYQTVSSSCSVLSSLMTFLI